MTATETDRLAADIRSVDGDHSLGAGALAEALINRGWRAPTAVELHIKHLNTGSPVLDANCPWCEQWMRSLELASGLRTA